MVVLLRIKFYIMSIKLSLQKPSCLSILLLVKALSQTKWSIDLQIISAIALLLYHAALLSSWKTERNEHQLIMVVGLTPWQRFFEREILSKYKMSINQANHVKMSSLNPSYYVMSILHQISVLALKLLIEIVLKKFSLKFNWLIYLLSIKDIP